MVMSWYEWRMVSEERVRTDCARFTEFTNEEGVSFHGEVD
jgi:hypothetical protein